MNTLRPTAANESGLQATRRASRKWCKHIKWETTTYGWKTYYFHDGNDAIEANGWAICPKCSAVNPTLDLSPKESSTATLTTKEKKEKKKEVLS